MPAIRTTTSTRASSNREASSYNLDRFLVARNDATRPYPSETDVYRRSTIHNPDDDGFFDLGLCDFLVANRRVARRRLDRLSVTPYQSGLLSRGAQHRLDPREPYNMVLEAALGYTASCSVAAFDEVASVFERTDELDRRVIVNRDETAAVEQRLRERVRDLEVRVEVKRDLRREATRNIGELRGLVNDLVSTVGDLRDDLARVRMMGGVRGLPLGRGEPQPLVEYRGRLVPIMDSATSSVPSLLGSGRLSGTGQSIQFRCGSGEVEIVADSEDEEEVVDLGEEEEEQVREAARNSVETLDAEIRRARADPAPEYFQLPDYEEVVSEMED